jgi:eukaryotic-like serine/threonine-protein kinase
MSRYPSSIDYFKAVQHPTRAFTLEYLQKAKFVEDRRGQPALTTGSSAVVFQATVDGAQQALRCFLRSDASTRERYAALSEYLGNHDLSPHVSATTWLDAAIQVDGATWPVLQMEWIEGQKLDQHVDSLVNSSNKVALAALATRWRELVALLQRAEFAHGDLRSYSA